MKERLEGLRKIRRGLEVLIGGMIEDTIDSIKEMDNPIIREHVAYRILKIGEYLSDAKTYGLPVKKLRKLEEEYEHLKNRVKLR